MKKKIIIVVGGVILLIFLLFPVKEYCGGKGRTCAYQSEDGHGCVSKQIKPNFASILDVPINYSDTTDCK